MHVGKLRLVLLTFAIAASISAPARAQNEPAAPPTRQAGIDPAMQRMLAGLSTVAMANFAASIASGTLDGFDPGPTLEKTLRNTLASREFNDGIDRFLAQAVAAGSEGSSGLPPEFRQALAAALKGVINQARAEMLREFSDSPRK